MAEPELEELDEVVASAEDDDAPEEETEEDSVADGDNVEPVEEGEAVAEVFDEARCAVAV